MEDISQHGGPCLSSAAVDKLLNSNHSNSKKLLFIKSEIRYLKQILGIQDKRLVLGKKELISLSTDLKSVLDMNLLPDSVQHNAIDETPSDKSILTRAKRKYCNDSDYNDSCRKKNKKEQVPPDENNNDTLELLIEVNQL